MSKRFKEALQRLLDRFPDIPGRTLLKRWGWPRPWRRVFMFWEVSVSGWLIDTLGLLLLVELGVPVFVAACISPLPALLWCFVLSTYKIYFREKGFSRTRFGYYVLFNLEMMVFAAWVISLGAKAGYWPVAMKMAVTPVTFGVNFFFTRLLLKQR